MPHTPWLETQPLGTADSGTIDDIIRALKVQIRERMNDIVVDWTADPVVLKTTSISKTGLKEFVAPFGLSILSGSLGVDSEEKFVQITGGVNNGYIDIPARTGTKITKIEALIDPNGNTVLWTTRKTSFTATPASTTIGTGSATGGPLVAIVLLFTGAETVGDVYFTAFFDGNGTWNFYGLRITYDEV